MALKHDAQGFLVGDPIDIGRALAVWDDIRSDVRAIRKAVIGASEASVKGGGRNSDASRVSAPRGGMEEADPAVKASPRSRDRAASAIPARRYSDEIPALLREVVIPARGQGEKGASASEKPGSPDAVARPKQKSAQQIAKPAGRDGRGRFTKGDGRQDGAPPNDSADDAETGALRSIADRIVGAVAESSGGMEEADPAVKAFNEVAQPMARGYEMLTGGSEDKKQTGLLRRVFGTLDSFRKEESAFNKAANRSLKNLEAKPEGGENKGSGFASLLSSIPIFGPALAAIANFPGKVLGGVLGGSKWAGAGLAGLGKGALGAGKGLLKRIPILGALLSLGEAGADIYSSENDDNLSRREKDKNAGRAVGGAAGGIGGMLAGAATGAAIGSAIPVIGTAIGAVVGGAAGMFFGDKAGKIIGETMGGWVNDLRAADIPGQISNAWNEVKVTALGTWDWIKSGWDDAVSGLGEIFKTIEKTWGGFVDSTKAGWDTIANLFTSAYDGLKSLPVIGPAIQAVEDAAKKTAEAAGAAAAAAKARVVEVGTKAVDTAKSAAGTAWDGAKSAAANLVPEGLKNKVAARRAIETGADYKQGNIAGLDDAHTRALVASTAATESGGGKLDVVNSAGYMGRYQAGAGWLADAGQINGGSAAVKAAMKADGFTSEYKWGQSGGMTRFLKDDKNWANGMSYDKYLSSADAQDAAFKTNSDKSYQSLVKKGVITKDMSQDDIAGILKARHIAGEGGAAQAARGAEGPADANGTTALKYKTDLAAGNIYTKAFSSSAATATPVAVAQSPSPVVSAAPVVATVQAPKAPSFSAPPPIADAPAMVDPLASNAAGGKKTAAVTVSAPDAGQDLRDRKIAHIVTGGLSSA